MVLETNKLPAMFKDNYRYPCEPKLSSYNLRNHLSIKENYNHDKLISNILLLSNGKRDIIEISDILKEDIFKISEISFALEKAKLIKQVTK